MSVFLGKCVIKSLKINFGVFFACKRIKEGTMRRRWKVSLNEIKKFSKCERNFNFIQWPQRWFSSRGISIFNVSGLWCEDESTVKPVQVKPEQIKTPIVSFD